MKTELSLSEMLQKQINKDNKRKEKSLNYMMTITQAINKHNKKHEQELKEIAEIYEQQQKAEFTDENEKNTHEIPTQINENTTSHIISLPKNSDIKQEVLK